MSVRWCEPRRCTCADQGVRGSSGPRPGRRRWPPPTAPGRRRTPPTRRRRSCVPACRMPVAVRPGDDVAGDRRARVVLGGDDDRDRRRAAPGQRADRAQVTGRGGGQQRTQRGVEQLQHHLGLRVAEPAVELDHLRPGRGQHQPRVEQPGERRAAAGHLGQHRVQHACAAPGRPARPAPTAAARRRPCRRCSARRRRRRPA